MTDCKQEFSDMISTLTSGMTSNGDRRGDGKDAWLEGHKRDMQMFIDRNGVNHVLMTDGIAKPTDIPVPRGNGICDDDFVDTGTLK